MSLNQQVPWNSHWQAGSVRLRVTSLTPLLVAELELEGVDGPHPLSKTPVGVQPWTWVKGNNRADRLAGKQPSQVARFSEDLKCWEAWDTTCGHNTKDTTPSIACRREAWKEEALDDLPWKDERGPSSIRWTRTVSKATMGKLLRDGAERIWAFPSAYIPSWMNWTKFETVLSDSLSQVVPVRIS